MSTENYLILLKKNSEQKILKLNGNEINKGTCYFHLVSRDRVNLIFKNFNLRNACC